jgi:four helix bundle protein
MDNDLKHRTKTFAQEVIDLVEKRSSSLFERELSRQLIRSALSVGANTRAASRGERKSLLRNLES